MSATQHKSWAWKGVTLFSRSFLASSLNGRGKAEESPWERFCKRRQKVAFCSCKFFFVASLMQYYCKYLVNIFTELMFLIYSLTIRLFPLSWPRISDFRISFATWHSFLFDLQGMRFGKKEMQRCTRKIVLRIWEAESNYGWNARYGIQISGTV